MVTIDTARLRALALAATPGRWGMDGPEYHFYGPEDGDFVNAYVVTAQPDRTAVAGMVEPMQVDHFESAARRFDNDAAYIAAAGPTTMLALIDEIERLRGEGGWEYGTALPEAIQEDGMVYGNEKAALAHAATCGECVLVRRRKAGPWERVEGDGDA